MAVAIPRIELPWPPAKIPTYREGRVGPWSIEPTPALKMSSGYFLVSLNQPPGWVIRHEGQSVWMSLTAMEIESHLPHLAAATGNVIVAGLGMGFALYNVAAKPEVEKVTVLEKNPNIPRLLDVTTDWHDWPGMDKVSVVITDALTYLPKDDVDFLYADVWPHLGDYGALSDTVKMQDNVRASTVGYWGQEWDYVTYCHKHALFPNSMSYRRFANDNGLPLIERDDPQYPALCHAAVTLQLAAGDRTYKKKKLFERYADFLYQSQVGDLIDAEVRSQIVSSLLANSWNRSEFPSSSIGLTKAGRT